MKLTEPKRQLLAYLSRYDGERHGYLDAREIAKACSTRQQSYDWAGRQLKAMTGLGLVEAMGVSPSNARTWRITEAGLSALRAEREG